MFDVVIPWTSDGAEREEIFDWVLRRWDELYGDEANVRWGSSGDDPFSRSISRNWLARHGTSDVIVFADADTPPIKEFVDQAVELASRGEWVIAYGEDRYYNLTADDTRYLMTREVGIDIPEPIRWEHRVTSWAGMIAVPRAAFKQVGGYDRNFVGWGHEDVAFRLRMDNEYRSHKRVNGYVVHMWHPRVDATFDTECEIANRQYFDREYRQKYRWRDERIRRAR